MGYKFVGTLSVTRHRAVDSIACLDMALLYINIVISFYIDLILTSTQISNRILFICNESSNLYKTNVVHSLFILKVYFTCVNIKELSSYIWYNLTL